MRRALLTASLLALGACGADVTLPPAAPLSAPAEQLAQISHLERGPHDVEFGEAVELEAAGRVLRVRAVAPDGDGPFPWIVFSHGFASDIDQYDALLGHWASHGYVIIAPFHLDGGGTPRAIWNSLVEGHATLIESRVADVAALIAEPAALSSALPGLGERIDPRRLAVAGHSFGAFTAQQFGGAVAELEGEQIEAPKTRARAVVALSPPGEMFGWINQRSWRSMRVPMLATTGTWDVDGRFVTDWRQHRLSYETAPRGRNWLLVVEGADHYLGNLICRTGRDAVPQHDALKVVNALSVTFLKSHLGGGSGVARTFLRDPRQLGQLTGGFAALSRR